jgi:hypothetical protein
LVPTKPLFSFHRYDAVPPFVGVAVKVTLEAAQIVLSASLEAILTLATTLGFTTKVFEAVATPHDPPEVVKVKVTVPVNDEAGVYVASNVVAPGLKLPPAPPSL